LLICTAISLDAPVCFGQLDFSEMAKPEETQRLSWPWWAPWALIAVVLGCAATIGATLYDIL
jgi:hypothetical protein